jgi:hypothetical protein
MVSMTYIALDGMKTIQDHYHQYINKYISILITACFIVSFSLMYSYTPLHQYVMPKQWRSLQHVDSRNQFIWSTIQQIQPNAAVISTRLFKTPLSNRKQLWDWYVHPRAFFPNSLDIADYVLLDINYLRMNDKTGLNAVSKLTEYHYGILFYENDILFAKKNHRLDRNQEIIKNIIGED